MENFFIFYAPFIVVALALVAAFWLGLKDGAVHRSERK
ncbi:cytochrome bd oxidase small subunit CydS [Bacillus sp. JJ1474]